MFKHTLLLACLTSSIFLSTPLQAQQAPTCGATEVNEARRKAGHLPKKEVFEKWIAENISKLELARTEDGTGRYIVPIVYHIIHTGEPVGTGYNISYNQILSQHRVINEDFNRQNPDSTNTLQIFKSRAANFGIEFRLAEIDPNGNRLAEPGVVRHNISALGLDATKLYSDDIDKKIAPSRVFPPNFAINQFVVPSAAFPPENPGDDPTPLHGYASFPGDSGNKGDDSPSEVSLSVTVYTSFGSLKDGNFNVGSDVDRGRTTTHELGHYFALMHIWGDENECDADDNCDDTPKQAKSNQGSNECGKVSPSCEAGLPEMRQNYMDYTDDVCLNLFTNDQKKRFLAVMKNSKTRKDLPFSEAIRPHIAPSNLTATLTSNNEIELKWKDNSDNEKEFVLERSEDGKPFEALPKLMANNVSFVDNSGLGVDKKYTYRVKAVNRAGETAYSNISNEVTVGGLTSFESELISNNLNISPNPTNGLLKLQLSLSYSSELKITVVDLLGKVVASSQTESNTAHHHTIDLSKLSQGLYLIKVETHKGFATKKVLLQNK